MALNYKNASVSTVTFTGLKKGQTYYVGECEADGTSYLANVNADGTLYTVDFSDGNTVEITNNDGSKTIYFGPMGCRTGFYLLLSGSYESKDIVPLLREMFTFIEEFEGEVPGASPKDCGNYLDMNLPMAKYLAKKYLNEVLNNITEKQLKYPE